MREKRELTAAEHDAWCAQQKRWACDVLAALPPRAHVFDARQIAAADLETLKTSDAIPWGDVQPAYDAWLAAHARAAFAKPEPTALPVSDEIHRLFPAEIEALERPPRANRCDCPGCAPCEQPCIEPRAEQAAFAHAIRFAGLNTPDRKQMGAAQTLAREP